MPHRSSVAHSATAMGTTSPTPCPRTFSSPTRPMRWCEANATSKADTRSVAPPATPRMKMPNPATGATFRRAFRVTARLRPGTRPFCPVNATADCITCHMPVEPKDSFRMVDHWNRVAAGPTASPKRAATRSEVRPRRLFLRMILVDSERQAGEIRASLDRGVSFFDLARRYSKDPSATSGGFLGAMWLDRMEPKVAATAAVLEYGGLSPVVDAPGGHIILERMLRDFRWRANALFLEAGELKRKGQLRVAIEKNQQALELYPAFLRALLFLGISLGEQGDAGRAAAVMETAAGLYPRDTGAQLNLGIAHGALGRAGDEIQAYRRALAGEPDLVSAYLNLGAALLSAGQPEQAAATFRQGIQINPLSPALYYNLSLVYEQQGKSAEARETMAVAARIDPHSVTRRPQ